MNRKRIVIGGVVLALAAAVTAAGLWDKQSRADNGRQAAAGQMSETGRHTQKIEDMIKETIEKKAEEQKKVKQQAQEDEERKKQEAAKRTVALDPGHQSFSIDMSAKEPNGPGSQEMKAKCTSGTTGKYTGLPEYQLALDISRKLRTELEDRGYQVVLTREDNDTAISNAERAVMAADSGADIYVRIHANGSEDPSVSGALALVPSTENPYVAGLAGQSHTLAETVLGAYCGQTGLPDKGIQMNDTMTGINWSRVPVMILEMGFMSNENDDYSMADAEFQTRMVRGIADGIDQYFGVE